jgi:hypothetical protein
MNAIGCVGMLLLIIYSVNIKQNKNMGDAPVASKVEIATDR